MEIRLADTFSASLARLNGQEQKAAKITAVDLQLDPSSPGLQFHRIDRAKDPNFWSLRVNRDLRIIVHKTPGSLLLCHVDHHDKAYAWAVRRRIEAHPRTGTIQIVETRAAIEQIAPTIVTPEPATIAADARRPFVGLSEDAMLSVGVPVDWTGTIRSASEDDFLALADHLPPEAAEALLDYAATGMLPAPPMALPEVPVIADRVPEAEAPRLDFTASPDTQRRFRVVENVEELEAALAYPWERWTVFLHPTQRAIAEQTLAGPARVAGSAGTGKTIVALHRAARLASADPDAKVLLTTFSEPLANALARKLRILLGDKASALARISVTHFQGVAEELYQLAFGRRPGIASADLIRSALQKAAEAAGVTEFDIRFLVSEWTNVVDAWQLQDESGYASVSRLGRKNRLGAKQRERLWPVFAAARRMFRERGARTAAEIFGEVSAYWSVRADKPFTSIVVDEAQDLGVAELRLLAAIAPPGTDALFFAGDIGQRIFQHPFSWRSLGIDVRGRSLTLKVNYRTSHQIRSMADRLLPRVVRDVDGLEQDRAGTVSVFNGPMPTILRAEDQAAEAKGVAAFIKAAITDDIAPAEIGVFVRSRNEMPRAREAVRKAGFQPLELSGRIEQAADRIAIGTMHLAKGLEFRAVAVLACDDDILPQQARVETVADEIELDEVYETERHLFYVACTRARDRLLVSGVSPGSEFLDDFQGDCHERRAE